MKIKPKPPIGRFIREGDLREKCVFCNSSIKRSFFGKKFGCIQPECGYYWKGRKNEIGG